MNMLYVNRHCVLAYNEFLLFNEMGIDVFSIGPYLDPIRPKDNLRPPILGIEPKPEFIKSASQKNITKKFIDNFDIICVVHFPTWLIRNFNVIKNKIVIWRTIGQSTPYIENMIKPFRRNIKIVRYSPFERNIPGYIGDDVVIRFHLDPNEFKNWNGNTKKIISITGFMKKRRVCNYNIFDIVTKGLPRILYGRGNENVNIYGGILSYDNLKQVLRNYRVYFYTGTQPASYTLNFIEAWMTGIPIVAIGNKYGNGHYFNQNTYEISQIIKNGVNGFCSDNIQDLSLYCKMLLENDSLAKQIGLEGRKCAIEYFGKDKIKEQWTEFFKSV